MCAQWCSGFYQTFFKLIFTSITWKKKGQKSQSLSPPATITHMQLWCELILDLNFFNNQQVMQHTQWREGILLFCPMTKIPSPACRHDMGCVVSRNSPTRSFIMELHFTLADGAKKGLSHYWHLKVRGKIPLGEASTEVCSFSHFGPSLFMQSTLTNIAFPSQPQNYLAYLVRSSRSCFCGSFICWN